MPERDAAAEQIARIAELAQAIILEVDAASWDAAWDAASAPARAAARKRARHNLLREMPQ